MLTSIILLQAGATQHTSGLSARTASYSNQVLGFRYTAPREMQDETASGRAEVEARASARHTSKMLDLLFAMTSGADDTAPGWHSLIVETYPRKAFSNLDDIDAEAKMSAWVAGFSNLPEAPRTVVLRGQSFAVSVFGQQEGTVKKGAVVWTTLRRGKLLSFAFVANSPQQLMKLAESMKSVEFF